MIVFAILLATATAIPATAGDAAGPSSAREIARVWHPGQPIPQGLREHRTSLGCFPDPEDSSLLIADLENVPLLLALVLDPQSDALVHEDALARALALVGPNRFFAAIAPQLATVSPRLSEWAAELRTRMQRRHVVVDGLFVDFEDMPREAAQGLFDRIEAELRHGTPWPAVYQKYSALYEDSTGRTKVGNLGDFVLFPDPGLSIVFNMTRYDGYVSAEGTPRPRRLSHFAQVHSSHIPVLLRAQQGAVVRRPNPSLRCYVLYRVREVYEPAGA